MVDLCPLIMLGSMFIPSYQGEDICVLEVKQPSNVSSETQVPGKILWTLSTPSGLTCAHLCLQNSSCLFYGYQSHVCHGYTSSKAHIPPAQMPAIVQGHIWKYKSKAVDDGYRHLTSGSTHLNVKRHNHRLRRNEALEECQAEGATLVKLDSREKIGLFAREFRNKNGRRETLWIGLSDRYDNDTWYWTDGTGLSQYRNWDSKEPHYVMYGKKENCVGILLSQRINGKWFDKGCQHKERFVCEKDSSSANNVIMYMNTRSTP